MPFAPSSPSHPATSRSRGHQALFAAVLLAGCSAGDGLLLPGGADPAAIRVVHGDGLSGRVGEPLNDSVVVEVSNSRGRPVEGASVAFELISAAPGAEIDPATATTDGEGHAHARMVLGTRMGPQSGQARVVVAEGTQEPKASFTVTALSEHANGMAAVSGDGQRGPAGSALAEPLVVEVTDVFGNPISGVPISWTVEGGGSVSEATVNTGSDGRASVVRRLGAAAGPQAALASSEGLAGSPVTFTHTATAGNASDLSIVSGNNQTAAVGTRLPADLVVRLVDADGNAVQNTAVTWVVGTGGGSVTPENGVTDDAGRSSAQWTLGPNPGDNRVDAVVSGVGFVTFSATGIRTGPVPTVTTITRDAPDPSVAGSAFTVEFRVTSAGPTPTGSVTVTVNESPLSCSSTLQGGVGSCSLTLNRSGNRTLRATYSGGPGFSGSSDTEDHGVSESQPQNRAPDADFNSRCEGLTCQFTDASRDPDGQVTGWSWDFGDGSAASNQQNPSHLYPGGGTYTVTLTATDNSGASDVFSARVEVKPPPGNKRPQAEFEVTCTNLTCTFTDKSKDDDGTIVNWHWDFGDGQSVNEQSPSHQYAARGTYKVTLTVTDNGGASDSKDHDAHPEAPPPSQAATTTTITGDSPDPSDPGVPITVSFTVTSPGGTPTGPVQVTDEVGGSCTGSAPSGSCSYTPSGTGTRTITATYEESSSFSGSSDTEDHTVNAPPPPNQAPSFDLSNSDLSANMGESRTEPGWAQNISAGPPSESGQVVTFQVSNDRPDLFSVAPSISQDGTLTFTTSTGEGDSIVTVQLQDNGGTANGGEDTSAPQTFTIHISGGGGG